MFEKQSKRIASSTSSAGNTSSMNIGADLSGDSVFLKGEVIPSVEFARAMTTLGKVVKLTAPTKKDRTAYQKWVQQKYLEELEEEFPDLDEVLLEKNQELQRLNNQHQVLYSKQTLIHQKMNISSAKRRFWNWLYTNNRDAWVVLDPIVSVQKDGTFFEAFSQDESVYARVFLPHSALQAFETPSLGTTNIDYGTGLDREFKRSRSYRPLSLQVGLNAVSIATAAADVVEERIPLPESWVLGLVEVQSVLSLAQTTFTIQTDTLADLIARLEAEREKQSPRSLKFLLSPGKPIRIEIEPWGEVYRDEKNFYQGESEKTIRIWGRRRLLLLKDLLVQSETVQVSLMASGMPSFWTIENQGVEITVGLSGWTANDWASKAKFSGFIPTITVRDKDREAIKELIKQQGEISTNQAADQLKISSAATASVLQSLCMAGKAMFDPKRNIYRWRDLFPFLDLESNGKKSTEEEAGFELSKLKSSRITSNEMINNIQYIESEIAGDLGTYSVKLELDLDGRPKYAECGCPFFRYNKLKSGPCRHLVATTLLVGEL